MWVVVRWAILDGGEDGGGGGGSICMMIKGKEEMEKRKPLYQLHPDGDGDDNRGSEGSDDEKEDKENQFMKGIHRLEKKASSP